MSLLNEIQRDALDPGIDTASLLRKCMVLAAKLGNKDFQEWVNHELYGYHEGEDLPNYRIRIAASYGHFTTGAGMWQNLPISYYPIPEELKEEAAVYFTPSVSSLEQMVRNAKDGSLHFNWSPDLLSILRHKFYEDYTCIAAYKHVSTSTVVEILSTIRTKALEFILEIQKEAPDAGEAPFGVPSLPDGQTNQIFNTIIMGNVQNLAPGSSNVIKSDKEQKPAYDIGSQQAGGDILQAGGNIIQAEGDVILLPDQLVTAGPEQKKAKLEMLVEGNRLCIINRGSAKATNIEAIIDEVSANDWDEFVKGELPFKQSLKPGQSTCKLWGCSRGSPRSMNYKITWINEDGTSGEDEDDDFRLFS